ncbi:MAG: hypothetical protein IKG98_05635 [Ruminococcus sp.]|nr:hypothetical protein [Ruminococcus sp.]
MPKKYRVEFSGTVYIVAESLREAEEILIANPELTLDDDDLQVEAFDDEAAE